MIDRREFGLEWNAPLPKAASRSTTTSSSQVALELVQGGLAAMRILGLSGSLRRDSHNTRLLAARRHAAARRRRAGAVRPAGRDPALQRGRRAPHAPAVEALKAAIDGADALLIATPEYNASIPGVLKNALDWISRPVATTPLRGKPAAVIGASTSLFGAVWAQAETRKVLSTIGARVVDRELPIPQAEEALGADGLPRDHDAVEQLAATLDELLELAEPRRIAA